MHALVVGSGVAGLTAALALHGAGIAATVVTKGRPIEGSTRWAQGGIAAAIGADDSVERHVEDTLAAGAGLSDERAVRILCSEGPERIAELVRLGMPFDRTSGGLALGREAAHSRRRILHAGGDATGLALATTLLAEAERRGIEIVEQTMLRDLVIEDGVVRGASLLGSDGESVVRADAVLLATGGAGQLYPHTTNPDVATGDGIATAWRAGALVRDLEFYQFHPTALAIPGTPLISEAVRGEGGTVLDLDGRRFLFDEHPDGELAPRDVVARGIARAMARQSGLPVLLDATRIPQLRRRFPTITASLERAGFDWTREPVPVTPAAHYWMGGIATDLDGRTTLPGLFAAGEAAATGVHGANRLASNSLLEGLVFARRAASAIASALTDPAAHAERPRARSLGDRASRPPLEEAVGTFRNPLPAASDLPRERLHRIMWEHVGLFRHDEGLRAAIRELDALGSRPLDGVDSAMRREVTRADAETANLVQLGRLTARAALERRSSLGAHTRTDPPPAVDPVPARRTVMTLPPNPAASLPEATAC